MSSNIVLPTLSRWAEQHITALFQATSEDDFNNAYDAFFTKRPHIMVNGKHISTDDYKKQLWRMKFAESGAQVAFTGAVEVPDNSDKPVDAGNVGLFVQATIDDKFLILGAPATSTVTASYNITIIQDPSLKPPPSGPIHGFFDGRRVSALTKVSLDKRDPISLVPNLPEVRTSA